MYDFNSRPAGTARPRRQGPGYLPHSVCVGPCIPPASLWEEWRAIYATRTHAALIEEARRLKRDEQRLARSMIPDLMELGRIDMRLTLIDERLNASGQAGF